MNLLTSIFSACRKSYGTVSINGRTYHGKNVVIHNDGSVIVDGTLQPDSKLVGPITVNIEGDCDSVHTTSGDIEIRNGNAVKVDSVSGDIEIAGNVSEGVRTVSGDISCGSVNGPISTVSGDIYRD